MYKRQKLILRNLETQKLDELCLILTGVALVATIFLAPHHNSMRCVTMLMVVHIAQLAQILESKAGCYLWSQYFACSKQ